MPVEVPGVAGVTALASGFDTAYALLGDGTVWAWGDNSVGELGSGTHHPFSDAPVRVRGLDHVVAIAAGSETGYALDQAGNLWAWATVPTASSATPALRTATFRFECGR